MNSLSGGAGSISTQISNAIAQLDSNSTTNTLTGTPSISYTLSAFEQKDGVVEATFSPIQIGESQVTSAAGGWITDGLAAKAPLASPALTGTPTAPTADPGTNTTQIATTAFVKNAVAGLAGTMHFKGSVATLPDATNSTTFSTYEAGDVVLGPNNKEYVYNKGADAASSSWVELGDESSYAIKGSITNADIASNAAIEQSKIANLTADLATKQDELGFTTGTAYNKTTNPVATKDYVDSKAAAANTTYSFTSGDNDGEIKVTPSTNGVTGTAISVKPKNLKQIATSGSIYDIEEGSNTTVSNHPDTSTKDRYLILDCGTAEILID